MHALPRVRFRSRYSHCASLQDRIKDHLFIKRAATPHDTPNRNSWKEAFFSPHVPHEPLYRMKASYCCNTIHRWIAKVAARFSAPLPFCPPPFNHPSFSPAGRSFLDERWPRISRSSLSAESRFPGRRLWEEGHFVWYLPQHPRYGRAYIYPGSVARRIQSRRTIEERNLPIPFSSLLFRSLCVWYLLLLVLHFYSVLYFISVLRAHLLMVYTLIDNWFVVSISRYFMK